VDNLWISGANRGKLFTKNREITRNDCCGRIGALVIIDAAREGIGPATSSV
jgi:hypothetical protein